MLVGASSESDIETDLNVLQTALNEIYLTLFIALCSCAERDVKNNFHFRFMEMGSGELLKFYYLLIYFLVGDNS